MQGGENDSRGKSGVTSSRLSGHIVAAAEELEETELTYKVPYLYSKLRLAQCDVEHKMWSAACKARLKREGCFVSANEAVANGWAAVRITVTAARDIPQVGGKLFN